MGFITSMLGMMGELLSLSYHMHGWPLAAGIETRICALRWLALWCLCNYIASYSLVNEHNSDIGYETGLIYRWFTLNIAIFGGNLKLPKGSDLSWNILY